MIFRVRVKYVKCTMSIFVLQRSERLQYSQRAPCVLVIGYPLTTNQSSITTAFWGIRDVNIVKACVLFSQSRKIRKWIPLGWSGACSWGGKRGWCACVGVRGWVPVWWQWCRGAEMPNRAQAVTDNFHCDSWIVGKEETWWSFVLLAASLSTRLAL